MRESMGKIIGIVLLGRLADTVCKRLHFIA